MPHWRNKGPESSGFQEIQRGFEQMLEDGRHIFDAASNALLGGTDPEAIRADLFATDDRINRTEQQIRRQIVVHGTVHGAQSFPALLVLMSVAKDAERIGDYAKNIFDLAIFHPDFGGDEEERKLIDLKDQISDLVGRARELYEAQDDDGARRFLAESDRIQDLCDANLERALSAPENTAGRALAYRYFKRVTSHAANVVTSLVMPLDKLDFFDEG
jgi:phosphate transport system protein